MKGYLEKAVDALRSRPPKYEEPASTPEEALREMGMEDLIPEDDPVSSYAPADD
jgi:hypothetical protein